MATKIKFMRGAADNFTGTGDQEGAVYFSQDSSEIYMKDSKGTHIYGVDNDTASFLSGAVGTKATGDAAATGIYKYIDETASAVKPEVCEDSKKFKIGTSTYQLIICDDGKIAIDEVQYKAPSVSLSATPSSVEVGSGTQSVTIKNTVTTGLGEGTNPTSIKLGTANMAANSSTSEDVTANKSWTLTYQYVGEDGATKTATAKASISYNKYAVYTGTTMPTATDIPGNNLATSLPSSFTKPAQAADGYAYIAVPASWGKSGVTETVNTTPKAFEFSDSSGFVIVGGWVAAGTVANVYGSVNYVVYRTAEKGLAEKTWYIRKKA